MPKKKVNKTLLRFPFVILLLKHIIHGFLSKSSFRTKILTSIGLLLIIIPTFFYINEGVQLAFFTPKVIATAHSESAPSWISIPAIGVELPIFETKISNGIWGVAQNGISHLTTSARPGEVGTSILYGHNTNDRFGPIRWLERGTMITLTAGTNRPYVYVVEKTLTVSPDEVSILLSQKGETLILYTCDGFADLNRFIVIAKPVTH